MAADASAPEKPATFEAALESRLSPEIQRRLRLLHWRNRFTSLWAPATVFLGAFVVYLFIVELHTPSYLWAQPVIQAFGLLMLAVMIALAVLRSAWRKFGRLRLLRHKSFDLLGEVGPVVGRHREKLSGAAFDDLVNHCAALAQGMLESNPDKLEGQLKATTAIADRHLSLWRKQSTLDFVMGFVKAFAIAMIIRAILIEPFRIPSGSMIPTLQIGDQIFVNKFIYGVRLPWLNIVPFVIVRPPERGDVIVFNNPLDESRDFIKRVVGIPGDRIELEEGVVLVNGVPQPRQLLDADYVYWDRNQVGDWVSNQIALYRETLDGRRHLAGQALTGPRHLHEGPYVVPPKHVFVMGDNRENSSDSRYGFGVRDNEVAYVPYGNIKGKAMVIWLALGHGGLLDGLFGGTGLRTERFFLPVR